MEIQDGDELCFPQLPNSSCRKPSVERMEAVFLKTLIPFICLITVVLNLLVIISVSHFRQGLIISGMQLHTPTNILLLSLAVSDFLVGLLLIPLEILRSTSCWFHGDIVCVLCLYLSSIIPTASIGNIILITVDRYVAICHPLNYSNRITLERAKYSVCVCWLWYSFYNSFYLREDLIQLGRSNSCVGKCTISINYLTGTVDLILNFIFPVTVIIVLYMRVFVVAVSQARAMRSHIIIINLQHSVNIKPKKSELKAARRLGILVLVYLISFFPYYIYSLVVVDFTSTTYAAFLFVLCYFNSCLNPIIYALFYSWFRKAIKLIVTLQILQPGSSEASIL